MYVSELTGHRTVFTDNDVCSSSQLNPRLAFQQLTSSLRTQLRRAPEHPAEGAKPQHRPDWKPVKGAEKQ